MDVRDVQQSAAKAVRGRALGAFNKDVNDLFVLLADDGRTLKKGFRNAPALDGGRHGVQPLRFADRVVDRRKQLAESARQVGYCVGRRPLERKFESDQENTSGGRQCHRRSGPRSGDTPARSLVAHGVCPGFQGLGKAARSVGDGVEAREVHGRGGLPPQQYLAVPGRPDAAGWLAATGSATSTAAPVSALAAAAAKPRRALQPEQCFAGGG